MLLDWSTTLGLVFGGCCSNAITLEQLTSHYPHAGSLITLFQFVLISLHGLPTHVAWTRYGPRFKPRRIPLAPYLIQVGLFYLISLLNNAAFGYNIPMSVHIIFRSGGLIVSMLLGWLISGKRYNLTQVISVLLVTLGVALTTLSATPSSSQATTTTTTASSTWNYILGILILSLALVLSGFLGLVQDRTYAIYGRRAQPRPTTPSTSHQPPQWQESMFYLHFLSLPMFLFLRKDLQTQFHTINNGPRSSWSTSFSLPSPISTLHFPNHSNNGTSTSTTPPPFLTLIQSPSPSLNNHTDHHLHHTHTLHLHLPYAYTPLLLNTLTQLLCVAGVHRLTTRVSALTVTLVLVVRKAVSLILSVLGPRVIFGGGKRTESAVDQKMMWIGGGLVLIGTVLYSFGTGRSKKDKKE